MFTSTEQTEGFLASSSNIDYPWWWSCSFSFQIITKISIYSSTVTECEDSTCDDAISWNKMNIFRSRCQVLPLIAMLIPKKKKFSCIPILH